MYGVVSASKIIGEVVENRQKENLGKIHELVIDPKEGHVAYAARAGAVVALRRGSSYHAGDQVDAAL
jgi:hypothetical protein